MNGDLIGRCKDKVMDMLEFHNGLESWVFLLLPFLYWKVLGLQLPFRVTIPTPSSCAHYIITSMTPQESGESVQALSQTTLHRVSLGGVFRFLLFSVFLHEIFLGVSWDRDVLLILHCEFSFPLCLASKFS